MFKVMKYTQRGDTVNTPSIIFSSSNIDECHSYIENYLNGYFGDDVINDDELFTASMRVIDYNSVENYYRYIGSSVKADFSEVSIKAQRTNYEDGNILDVVITLKVTRELNHSLDLNSVDVILDQDAICPDRAHDVDAGLDLFAPCFCIVPPMGHIAIDTGVHIDIPEGYVGKLESKSGLMRNNGLTCRGTIDARYHGTLVPILFNHTDRAITFERGDKITQLVIYPIATPMVNIVDEFTTESERGNNGFGSTGK